MERDIVWLYFKNNKVANAGTDRQPANSIRGREGIKLNRNSSYHFTLGTFLIFLLCFRHFFSSFLNNKKSDFLDEEELVTLFRI